MIGFTQIYVKFFNQKIVYCKCLFSPSKISYGQKLLEFIRVQRRKTTEIFSFLNYDYFKNLEENLLDSL